MAKTRRVTYKPDHKSFGQFILSEQMRDVTSEVAHDIARRAGQRAPKRKERGAVPEGAQMADRFRVNREAGVLSVGEGGPRVMVHVFNDARSAAPNEFGSKRNKRYRMLGKAGAEFGDFKPEGGL